MLKFLKQKDCFRFRFVHSDASLKISINVLKINEFKNK
jgi:hypothetical protein